MTDASKIATLKVAEGYRYCPVHFGFADDLDVMSDRCDMADSERPCSLHILYFDPSASCTTEAPLCDVTACQAAAVTCVVGEAGDFWLCAEHATPSGTSTEPTEDT